MIFGKKDEKKEETLDEMLEKLRGHMKNMTDEEKKKVMDKLSDGKVTTGEQVEKAKEDAESKGEKPTQAEIDMSVGEQEKLDGNEDSQSAKDRVEEYEGEEKALKEEGKADGEKHDEAAEEDKLAKLEAKVDMLVTKLAGQFGWNDEDAEKAEKAKKVYGLGEGVVADKGEDAKKAVTAKEIGAVLSKFM